MEKILLFYGKKVLFWGFALKVPKMRFFKFYEKSMEIFSFFAWSYCRILLTTWNDPNYFLENIYFCCFRVKTGLKWGFSSFMGNLPMEIYWFMYMKLLHHKGLKLKEMVLWGRNFVLCFSGQKGQKWPNEVF